jgi:hypothetical protein
MLDLGKPCDVAASILERDELRPRGSGIGSSKRFCQPRSADIIDGIAQALHSELDFIGLKVAPALNLSQVAAFREPLKIFRSELSGGDAQCGEFLADVGVSGHCAIKAQSASAGKRKTRR